MIIKVKMNTLRTVLLIVLLLYTLSQKMSGREMCSLASPRPETARIL